MYKVLKEDDKGFHVQHPDGSKFRVAKNGLDKSTLGKIKKMAGGGEVAKSFLNMNKSNQTPDIPGPQMPTDDDKRDSWSTTQNTNNYAYGGDVEPLKDISNVIAPDEKPYTPAETEFPKLDISSPENNDPSPQDIGKTTYQKYIDQHKKLGWMDLIPESEVESQALRLGERAKEFAQNKLDNAEVYANQDRAKGAQKQVAAADVNKRRAAIGLPPNQLLASNDQPSQPDGPTVLPQPSEASQIATGQPQVAGTDGQQIGSQQPIDLAKSGPMDLLNSAYGIQSQGIQDIANANIQRANAEASAIKANMAKQQDLALSAHKQWVDWNNEHQQLQQNVMDQKIDPNRLLSNRTTGSKIMSTIGILLSGIGSGLAGQPNMAVEMMNKMIDRDIEGQKQELGKKENLLGMNLQRFGKMQQALDFTKAQYASMLQGQLGLAAAQSASPIEQARAKMAQGELQKQRIEPLMNWARMSAEAKSVGGGYKLGEEPMFLATDPKYQAKRVVVDGNVYQANTDDEAKQVRTVVAKVAPVISSIEALDKLGLAALIPGSAEANQAQALRARLASQIPLTEGLNRINETEIHQALEQLKDPTKFKDFLRGGVKNNQLIKKLREEQEDTFKSKLLNYKGKPQYSTFKKLGQ